MSPRAATPAFHASTPPAAIGQIQHLSLDLRGARLTASEVDELQKRLEAGEDAQAIYVESLNRWLGTSFYRRLMSELFGLPRAEALFVGKLSRHRDDASGGWVYHLPSTSGDESPCPAGRRSSTVAWWTKGERVEICDDSFRPDHAFDEVGYCGGQADPRDPAPRRIGCGCGPLLIGCLPPEDEWPGLDHALEKAMVDEVVETATDIVASGRSYDELFTTSRTWQSGLTEFLYVRREMIGLLGATPYSATLEARLLARLAAVDLESPPRWVDREGAYRGSGLFLTTPLQGLSFPTYRSMMRSMLSDHLCVNFDGVNVTSDAILSAVKSNHSNLRSLKVHDSPMRNQHGCSGCHAPMDHGAAFLVGLTTPLMGSAPTGNDAAGKLYVHGAEDLRGEGSGFDGLMKLLLAQPELDECVVQRMFTYFVGRSPARMTPEGAFAEGLMRDFKHGDRDLRHVVRSILLSSAYRSPVNFE